MDDYRKTLRLAGLVLIAVALVDLGEMVYTMVTRGGVRSNFGLFALIPGICLLRGSLRWAWWVAFFAAGSLGLSIGVAGLLPTIVPAGILVPAFRSYPLLMTKQSLVMLLHFAVTVWVLLKVTAPSVLMEADRRESPEQPSLRVRPLYGFIAGTVLAAVMVIGFGSFLRSDGAQRARAEAARKTGPGYQYFVCQLFWESAAGKTVSGGRVIAYNPLEAREMVVRWKE